MKSQGFHALLTVSGTEQYSPVKSTSGGDRIHLLMVSGGRGDRIHSDTGLSPYQFTQSGLNAESKKTHRLDIP